MTITMNPKDNGKEQMVITYGNSEFKYDISKLGDGYIVQLQCRDEEYFDTIREAREAIQREVKVSLWEGHANISGMWSNRDLDEAISFITARSDRKSMFLIEFRQKTNLKDFNAVKAVLDEGCAEYFDRYDSDVAEHFISMYTDLNDL